MELITFHSKADRSEHNAEVVKEAAIRFIVDLMTEQRPVRLVIAMEGEQGVMGAEFNADPGFACVAAQVMNKIAQEKLYRNGGPQ